MAPTWIIQEQSRLKQVAEHDNIERLRQNVDNAKADLVEALLRRENQIMEG